MRRTYLNCDISIVALVFFVGVSSAYLTSVTHFSPYYFGLLLLIVNSFILVIHNSKMQNDSVSKALLMLISVITVFLIFNICFTKTFGKLFSILFLLLINQMSTLIVYEMCFLCSKKVDAEVYIKNAVNLYFWIEIFIGIADIFYRFAKRTYSYAGLQYFYNFKTSIMFEDSNWNGFIYMISFAFFLYLYDNYRIIGKWHLRILFFYCILSLSRAAVFSSILVIIYSRFIKLSDKKKKIYVLFLILFSIFILPFMFFYVSHDDSFNTKIVIIKGLLYYISHTPIDKLLIGFGSGFATSEYSLPYLNYAWVQGHLYVVIKIMDIGLQGLFLDFLYFIALIKKSNGKFLYMLLPFFVCGLSMCPTNLSYMYVFSGVLLYLENHKRGMQYGFNQRDNADLQCRVVCGRSNRVDLKSIIFKYRICDC